LNKINRECQEREDSIRLEYEQGLFSELTKMESFIAEPNSQQYELKIAGLEKKSRDLRKQEQPGLAASIRQIWITEVKATNVNGAEKIQALSYYFGAQ